jgi:hypothetical protein
MVRERRLVLDCAGGIDEHHALAAAPEAEARVDVPHQAVVGGHAVEGSRPHESDVDDVDRPIRAAIHAGSPVSTHMPSSPTTRW